MSEQKNATDKTRDRLQKLLKPPGSLGHLEDIAVQLATITGNTDFNLSKRAVLVFASDNGVVDEGIAAAPQVVTFQQTVNMTRGITGVSVLCKAFNADLIITDVGINSPHKIPGVIDKKIRRGTKNIVVNPAMTMAQAEESIKIGIQTAEQAAKDGYNLLGIGEMGIGNTTTAAAMLSAMTGLSPDLTAGKGAGLTQDQYLHKIDVIKRAIAKHKPITDIPMDILAKVGGFDIGAMAGAYIGAAKSNLPVVVDGFISIVASLLAVRIMPQVAEHLILSHKSFEQGYKHAAEALGLHAPLDLNMRLGEGSGCPIMFSVIDAACAMIKNMGTFEDGGLDEEYLEEVGGEDFNIGGL